MKSRGFTLVELLVSLVIITILLGTVIVFFQSQSRVAMDSKSAKSVNDEVGAALGMIASDLRKMGTGLGYLTPEVGASLYAAQSPNGVPQDNCYGDLYVNWTGWYDYDAIPTTARTYLPAETVFLKDANLDPTKIKSEGLKVPLTVNDPRSINVTHIAAGNALVTAPEFIGGDFGGLIGLNTTTIPPTSIPIPLDNNSGVSATGVTYGYVSAVDTCTATPTQQPNAKFKTIVFGGFGTTYNTVTPAVTYRLIPNSAGPPVRPTLAGGGQLARNWVPILGDPLDASGVRTGARGLQVTRFDITLRFVNSLGAQQDQPAPDATSYTPPGVYSLRDLKSVMVRLTYQWRIAGTRTREDTAATKANVSRSSSASIEVSPRCIVKAATQ